MFNVPTKNNLPSFKKSVDFLCFFFYELAIFTFLLLMFWAPMHALNTKHFNVVKTTADNYAFFNIDNKTNIKPGDILSAYRFSGEWQAEIGKVKVESVANNQVKASFDPEKFSWPMGRQGAIIGQKGNTVFVDIASNFKNGDVLSIFKDRQKIGVIKLTNVQKSPAEAVAYLIGKEKPDLKDLPVTEFTIATQVAFFNNKIIGWLEFLSAAIIAFAYFACWIIYKKSLFQAFFDYIKSLLKKIPVKKLWLPANLLFGWIFVWFMANLSVRIIPYFINGGQALFNLNFLHLSPKIFMPFKPAVYAILIFWYLLLLFKNHKSPILTFWDSLSYGKRKERIKNDTLKKIIIWIMNVVIVYVFAANLFAFLRADINAVLKLGWNNSGVMFLGSFNPLDIKECAYWIFNLFKVVIFIFTHSPSFTSITSVFEFMRYSLWSVTIVLCLFGYGYSLLSFLWGKHIRNVDFTIVGWLANGFCYPLFGVVIWQMVPQLSGQNPIITDGPLFYIMFVTELLLNILYTLSILNLGKMFGVMTDKGLKTTGFYSVVRHPSYTLELLMFITLYLVGLSTLNQWIAVCMFIFIYFIRSERDDDFMFYSNPGYAEYRKKTPYKFIPGIY